MSRAAARVLLSLLLLAPLPVLAQTSPPPPVRDPNGLAALQQAVTALGGAAIGQVQDCTATGTTAVATPSGNVSGTFTWIWAGGQFRIRTTTPGQTVTMVTGHGRPSQQVNGVTTKLFVHVTDAIFPAHLAAVVLQQALSNPAYSVKLIGPGSVGGVAVTKIQVAYSPDPTTAAVTQQVWSISTATGLPVHVDFRVPDLRNAGDLSSAAVDFANYQSVSGVAIPMQLTFYQDGQPLQIMAIRTMVFNTAPSPPIFDDPGGAQ